MTRRTTGPGFPKLKPKTHHPPVLTDKPPVRPRASTKGPIRYGKSRTITFDEQHRMDQLAAAEHKKKIGERKKVSKIRKAFARVPLAAFRLGGGGGAGKY